MRSRAFRDIKLMFPFQSVREMCSCTRVCMLSVYMSMRLYLLCMCVKKRKQLCPRYKRQ